jgi:hypothetical protein
MNFNKDIKQADYKTSFIVENMFKYILEAISAVSSAPDTTPDTVPDTAPDTTPDTVPDTTPDTAPNTAPNTAASVTPNITLKCIIARIFYNKRKMLFFILLIIIGVESYEKSDYTFKTGGGDSNCKNIANILYKLMHEFFFDSIPSKKTNVSKSPITRKASKQRGRPSNNSKIIRSSNKRKVDDDEYIPVKKNCINDGTTTRQTRSGNLSGGQSCIDNITEIFKYDSEIFHYSLLQNGKDLIVPYNIFEL